MDKRIPRQNNAKLVVFDVAIFIDFKRPTFVANQANSHLPATIRHHRIRIEDFKTWIVSEESLKIVPSKLMPAQA